MGGYDSWVQPFARISGQLIASGIAVIRLAQVGCAKILIYASKPDFAQIWMFKDIRASLPKFISLNRPPAVIMAFEMMGTLIEQMGILYLFIPMLPPLLGVSSRQRVKTKHHHDTDAPEVQVC